MKLGGQVEESSSIQFQTGDLIDIIITDVQPELNEKKELDALVPPNESWQDYAHFRDGILYKAVAFRKHNGEDFKNLVVVEDEKVSLPYGKFGFQFFHSVKPTNLFGKEGTFRFKVDASEVLTDGRLKPITYSISAMPEDWREWKSNDRHLFWTQMASAMLNCGNKEPLVNYEEGKWLLDMDTIHGLEIGDCTSCYITRLQNQGKSYPNYFLKKMVRNPVTKKWIVKKKYDLWYLNDDIQFSVKVANELNEIINKKSDRSDLSGPWDQGNTLPEPQNKEAF
jgi:hypothetical protein